MPTLRPAVPTDWPAIADLLMQCGLPEAGAQAHLGHFVVAVTDGALQGCAGLEVHDTVALLRSVAVARARRRSGLGNTLVQAALRSAHAAGCRDIYLLTTDAARCFERHGFAVMPRADAPAALQASAEFQGACPASATLMRHTGD